MYSYILVNNYKMIGCDKKNLERWKTPLLENNFNYYRKRFNKIKRHQKCTKRVASWRAVLKYLSLLESSIVVS